MEAFILTLIATFITFVILTKLPTGIEADSFGKIALAAVIFGVLNGLLGGFFSNVVIRIITFSLGNVILFGLTALIVKGFRLRWGVVSALIGGIGISIINNILLHILTRLV
ncbi:MAG: phage holin family protein [Cyanobacteria bacterium P01_D01_bin.36]